MSNIKPRDSYKQSAHRFADHYQQYSRAYEKDHDALANEIENIFSAIGLYGDLKAWQEVVDTVQLIQDFLDNAGYWEELVTSIRIAVESADNYFWAQRRDPKPELWHQRITLRVKLSNFLFRRGDYQEAYTHATEALKIARRVKHQKLEALILGVLGNIAIVQGMYKEAELFHMQGKTLLEAMGDTASLANAFERLATLAQSQGDLDQAWNLQSKRLSLVKQLNEQDQIADVLVDLGQIAIAKENYDEAGRLFDEGSEIYQDLGNQKAVTNILRFKSKLLLRIGKIKEARKLLKECLELERKYGDQSTVLSSMVDIASVEEEQGELEESYSLYEDGLELAETLGDLTSQVFCLQGLGRIQESRGEKEQAYRSFKEGLDIALKVGYAKLIAVSYDQIGLFFRKSEKYELANRYLNEALNFINRSDLKREKSQILFSLGGVASMRGRLGDAYKYYQEAFGIYEQLKQDSEMGHCLAQLSLVSLSDGDVQVAWSFLTRAIEVFRRSNDGDLKEMIIRRLNDFTQIPEYQTASKQILFSNLGSGIE